MTKMFLFQSRSCFQNSAESALQLETYLRDMKKTRYELYDNPLQIRFTRIIFPLW